MNGNQNLRQLALDVAATCFNDAVAMNIQLARLRTVSGWYCGQSGMSLDDTMVQTETLVGMVLDEVEGLRAAAAQG